MAILRRRKLILAAANVKPPRNAELDPLLDQLRLLRLRLSLLMRQVETEPASGEDGMPTPDHAPLVVSDAAEIADLLVRFGAEIPAEPELGACSANEAG